MIDYQAIIEELEDNKIIALMQSLGADRYKETDKAIIFPTICHNEDSSEASMKLYYYRDTHIFYCYTEEGSMSIFKFLKNYYDTRQITYDWYNDILQVILNCSASTAREASNPNIYKSKRDDYLPQKLRKELPTYPNGLIETFVKEYPYEWLNDHITKQVMDKFNIRYSISQNKIIIPHYNVNGELVGIRGRALNTQDIEQFGKYMPVQIENKWYSHPLSLNLYGLNWTKENIKKCGICYIGEAEKFVLQLESFSIPNCAVASCGSNLNKFQIDLLVRYCHPHEIIVCYDNEEKKGEYKYFIKLFNMCKKYINYANMSFIYDRKGLSKMKDSPSDNGQEIFEQLLKGRVRVK